MFKLHETSSGYVGVVVEKLWQNFQPDITDDDDDDATNRRNKEKIFTNPDMDTNENFQRHADTSNDEHRLHLLIYNQC
jgi:hypothetical protein